MIKCLSKLFKKKQTETVYTTITTISLSAVKTEYRCKSCRMIIPIDYPYCPFCGLKSVNSSFGTFRKEMQ